LVPAEQLYELLIEVIQVVLECPAEDGLLAEGDIDLSTLNICPATDAVQDGDGNKTEGKLRDS
jgi:hypothetical protein